MSFDLRRVRFYEWMLAFLGAALIGVMFARWYSVSVDGHLLLRLDAWQAFSVTDVVLAVIAAIALSVALAAATHRTAALPMALASLATFAGLVATILIAVRAASPPAVTVTGGSFIAEGVPVSRDAGLWLALVCAIGIIVCGWRSMSDEHFPEPMRPQLHIERLDLPSEPAASR